MEATALRPAAAELKARAADSPLPRSFAAALKSPERVALLAELKRRSPSAGEIRAQFDVAAAARAYEQGGADALSILTDREFFGGELGFLARAREVVELPVLRKDFLIDPLQLFESRAGGADAVLLIVRILSAAQLGELLGLAGELAMNALVEVHNAGELDRALAAGATLVGVNNRDLSTFRTDLGLSLGLASRVPAGVTLVAESGIRSAADVERLGTAGVDAILVGEALMKEDDLCAAAARLCGVTKQPRRAQ